MNPGTTSTAATTADIAGEPPAFEDRIWTLPPALPSAEPPSAPVEPAQVMSLDMPQYLGGNALTAVDIARAEDTGALFEAAPAGDPRGTAASDPGIAAAAEATPAGVPQGTASTDARIAVAVAYPPMGANPGMVTVVIPQAIVVAGEAFSFKLPSTMTKGPAPSQVSLLDGGPLPAWLRYEVDTWTFTATNMPGDALPIQVRVVIDGQAWIVRLTQQ